MGGSDKRKQSLYFPEEMLKEIQEEATRQDRSLSWIVQKAWKISRKEIHKPANGNLISGLSLWNGWRYPPANIFLQDSSLHLCGKSLLAPPHPNPV